MGGPQGARERIAARLSTIPGIQVHDAIPDAVKATPCAMLGAPSGGALETFDGGTTWTFPVRVVVSKWDGPRAQRALDPYLAPDGPWSLQAAIEAAGGDVAVSGIVAYGRVQFGGTDYAAAEVLVAVLA